MPAPNIAIIAAINAIVNQGLGCGVPCGMDFKNVFSTHSAEVVHTWHLP
jgi:hypothetical protein